MSEWKPNPVIKRALSSGPELQALIAVPIVERFGDEAKKVIADAMYQSGLERGRQLAAKAKDVNDLVEFERLNIEAYNAQGFNTPGFDDPARHWTKRTRNHVIFDLGLCEGCESNIPLVWKDMGYDAKIIQMLGEILCIPYDTGVRKGFNPKIEFTFTKLAPRGDPYCEWDERLPE